MEKITTPFRSLQHKVALLIRNAILIKLELAALLIKDILTIWKLIIKAVPQLPCMALTLPLMELFTIYNAMKFHVQQIVTVPQFLGQIIAAELGK